MKRAIGFHPVYPRTYRLYNIMIGIILLVLALPTMIAIVVALRLTQGADILYKGDRIGRKFRTFQILKFRTLCSDRAAMLTQGRTLPPDADIFTPMGRLLRETRLDELPQLFNVIRGDMNICGPRPVRREIRDLYAPSVSGYDDRFEVRPGLLGPTQAYFGHGASKRLRAKMNSVAVRRPVDLLAEIAFIFRVMSAMVVKLLTSLMPSRLATVLGFESAPDIWLIGDGDAGATAVEHITNQELKVQGILPNDRDSSIVIRMRSGGARRAQARVWLGSNSDPGTYRFEPINDYSAYVIERYALGKVVLPPPVNRVSTGTKKAARLAVSSVKA